MSEQENTRTIYLNWTLTRQLLAGAFSAFLTACGFGSLGRITSVSLALGKDGTLKLTIETHFLQPNASQLKRFSEAIRNEKQSTLLERTQ